MINWKSVEPKIETIERNNFAHYKYLLVNIDEKPSQQPSG